MQNGSSVGIRTRCVHIFAHLAPICMPQSVIINKISTSELSRKSIKSALLVGNTSQKKERACQPHSIIQFDFFSSDMMQWEFRCNNKSEKPPSGRKQEVVLRTPPPLLPFASCPPRPTFQPEGGLILSLWGCLVRVWPTPNKPFVLLTDRDFCFLPPSSSSSSSSPSSTPLYLFSLLLVPITRVDRLGGGEGGYF